ncbi:MAG TPA: hypothetical protein VF543_18020 [Pyrinomonadaceae bacterium]
MYPVAGVIQAPGLTATGEEARLKGVPLSSHAETAARLSTRQPHAREEVSKRETARIARSFRAVSRV